MAKTFDLSGCERVPLRRALRSGRRPARARLLGEGGLIPAVPMLWPCPLGEVEAPHHSDASVPEFDAYVVPNALVGGHGAQPMKDGAYLHASGAYPGYVKAYAEEDLAADRWSFDPRRLEKKRLWRGYALLHFNLMWGHWLTEVFPKLFAIRALSEAGVCAPIILPSTAPDYVRPIIEDVLPGQELATFDPWTEYLAVRQLILPPMLQHFYCFHPALGEALDAYAGTAPAAEATGRLFISRAGMRTDYAYREMSNQEEIESLAAENGLRVVRPEMLPWREQLALFASAGVIVGEFGSGLHNTLFSPRGAVVLSLNWIADIQSRITNFRQQSIGYLLPEDGRPRLFSSEHGLQRFRIGPSEFREKLAVVLDRAEARLDRS